MDAVFCAGKESDKYLKTFEEKRVNFIMLELSCYSADELKAILCMFRKEICTVELSA